MLVQIAEAILATDSRLHFIYRFFGTYLLQSSFFFLILAQKLGSAADNLILENCSINLRVLDAFVETANIDYQRTFARILRQTMSKILNGDSEEHLEESDFAPTAEATDGLDPGLLQYRWIEGYSGLWARDIKG